MTSALITLHAGIARVYAALFKRSIIWLELVFSELVYATETENVNCQAVLVTAGLAEARSRHARLAR